jgi:hypothetical protein
MPKQQLPTFPVLQPEHLASLAKQSAEATYISTNLVQRTIQGVMQEIDDQATL